MINLFGLDEIEGGGGSAEPGRGLIRDADGKLSANLGDGMHFDENDAIAVDPAETVTDSDMVNEDEIKEDIPGWLKDEGSD